MSPSSSPSRNNRDTISPRRSLCLGHPKHVERYRRGRGGVEVKVKVQVEVERGRGSGKGRGRER